MSSHSYNKIWLHLIWGTKGHQKTISPNEFLRGAGGCDGGRLSHPINCLPGGRQGWLTFETR